jgi:ribosomal protein S18 acetylase RimI-like enzyme
MEEARLADAGDLDAVEGVASRVAAELSSVRGGPLFLALDGARGSLRARLEASLADQAGRFVVGTYDGVVLGWGLASIRELPDGRRLGDIEALAVDAEARGVGIGEAMMNLLLAELGAADCFGVDCQALPGDRDTKNFFESFGLKARLLTVHRQLDPGGVTGTTSEN